MRPCVAKSRAVQGVGILNFGFASKGVLALVFVFFAIFITPWEQHSNVKYENNSQTIDITDGLFGGDFCFY